jgi:hypothetical protein
MRREPSKPTEPHPKSPALTPGRSPCRPSPPRGLCPSRGAQFRVPAPSFEVRCGVCTVPSQPDHPCAVEIVISYPQVASASYARPLTTKHRAVPSGSSADRPSSANARPTSDSVADGLCAPPRPPFILQRAVLLLHRAVLRCDVYLCFSLVQGHAVGAKEPDEQIDAAGWPAGTQSRADARLQRCRDCAGCVCPVLQARSSTLRSGVRAC